MRDFLAALAFVLATPAAAAQMRLPREAVMVMVAAHPAYACITSRPATRPAKQAALDSRLRGTSGLERSAKRAPN